MKNTVRVHRNGGKTPQHSQVQTSAGKGRAIPEPRIGLGGCYGGKEQKCLTIFDFDQEEHLAGCDITPQQMENITLKARLKNCSVGNLLADAVRKLANLNASDASELDNAFAQVKALFMMMRDSLENVPEPYNNTIQCGVLELIYATENRLAAAIKAATGVEVAS